MTRGMIFWMLMILWLIFGIVGIWEMWNSSRMTVGLAGGALLQFILFGLLGWEVYGPAVKG